MKKTKKKYEDTKRTRNSLDGITDATTSMPSKERHTRTKQDARMSTRRLTNLWPEKRVRYDSPVASLSPSPVHETTDMADSRKSKAVCTLRFVGCCAILVFASEIR